MFAFFVFLLEISRMFDFVRKHTKIMMFVMFLLIIPSFVLFGIDGYNKNSGNGGVVARISGHEITQGEWDAAHKSESDRVRASMPNLDPKLLDSPEARYATLERLVQERVLAQAAEKSKLTTSDARLARDLQENPTIASLRLPDGKLDMARYRELAASQGMTPEGFEAQVRQDLSTRQVQAGVTTTGFSATKVADVSLNAFFEKREIQVVNFQPSDFTSKVLPTETELEAFYTSNQAMFKAPEQASIEYIVLDLDSVKKSISINDSDLKSYYEQNVARLSGNEERRASHILINAAKSASEIDRQKAKVKADELLQMVRKSPEKFAEIAKSNSQDTGSAATGGDLDFFGRGAMVKPFEDAAFAMKKGEISDLVVSDFGFHIIKLTDIKVPKQRSFEELRPSIEADLKSQQAQRKFAETAEAFTNGVYEQSDSLKPIADKLKLEIKSVTNISRIPVAGVTGVLANSKFLAAIFSADAIEKKRNTEAIETAPNQLTAGRMTQYTPARTLPFNDVRAVVRERLVAIRAAELAKKEGQEKLAAWITKPSLAVMPASLIVSRDQSQNLPAQVLATALRTPASTTPIFVGVDLGNQGYAVVKVNKSIARQPLAAAAELQNIAQYAQRWTEAENQAYYKLLQERFKVEILTPRPTKSSIDLASNANK
jgi:peptidyl-prolyl cis-trans isomerase D